VFRGRRKDTIVVRGVTKLVEFVEKKKVKGEEKREFTT